MPPATFSIDPLDVSSVHVPYHFRCPVSLDLMRDPVTVSTGQTYDRPSIESWVAGGHDTCPVTRSPLTDFTLIPNHTLRRLIQDWCVAHTRFGVERIPTPKQPPDASTVRALLARCEAAGTPHAPRLAAMRRLRAIARDSEANRAVILSSRADARGVLLEVMFSGFEELSWEALAVLASCLPLADDEGAWVAESPARAEYLGRVMLHAPLEARVNAAAVLESAAASLSPELRCQLGGARGVLEGVVGVILAARLHPRAARVGVRAMFALCLAKQARRRAVEAGAAGALVDRLALTGDKGEAERALATVELLSRVPEGAAALAGHALTVAVLVRVMLGVSGRATEYAAGALLALCTAEEECQAEAVAAGVLTQLLLVVQSECTERAKRKAQLLVKLLQHSWAEFYTKPNSNYQHYACSEVLPF